jgi:hypothetical protein
LAALTRRGYIAHIYLFKGEKWDRSQYIGRSNHRKNVKHIEHPEIGSQSHGMKQSILGKIVDPTKYIWKKRRTDIGRIIYSFRRISKDKIGFAIMRRTPEGRACDLQKKEQNIMEDLNAYTPFPVPDACRESTTPG